MKGGRNVMTEDDLNRAVQEYQKNWQLYESFTIKLRKLIEELLEANELEVENVEYRTKSVERFSEKIRREDKSYDNPLSQVTDLCGLRVVTYYLEDVDKVGDIIRKEFLVDDENSLDKAEAMDPERFGYLSVHYVVSLSKGRARLTEWKPFSGFGVEIQVRTVLQHAWAAIDHKLRYKSAHEVPTNLKRQLFRLSALLELADTEFASLRTRAEATIEKYAADVKRGELDIEVNRDSLESYLESSGTLATWRDKALKAGFRPASTPARDEQHALSALLATLERCAIRRIAELDDLLREAAGWGPKVLADVKNVSADDGFVPECDPADVISILVMKAMSAHLGEAGIRNHGFITALAKAIVAVSGAEEAKKEE